MGPLNLISIDCMDLSDLVSPPLKEIAEVLLKSDEVRI